MASNSGSSSLKVIVLTFFGGLMLFTLPSILLLGLGMLPTFAAMMVDQRREKYTTLCVGCMNFVGVLPFVARLWTEERSFAKALEIIVDPFSWLVMLGAAGFGWCIFLLTPSIVSTVLAMRIEQRIGRLRRRQKELVGEWGPEVVGALNNGSLPEDEKKTGDKV